MSERQYLEFFNGSKTNLFNDESVLLNQINCSYLTIFEVEYSKCVELVMDNLTKSSNLTEFDEFYVYTNRPFVPPVLLQVIWSILFCLMVCASIFGNVVVIWIVVGHRRMRTVTNFFLLNLSIGDVMMATFNAIFNFVYMLHSHWPFGQTYCTLNNFIGILTVASSVFTITATSIDRFASYISR